MTQNVKRILLTLAGLLCLLAVRAQTVSTIIGQWRDQEEPDRQMEFYLDKDGLYYAKTINSKSKEMVNGQVLIKQLKYNETTKTFLGIMSTPDNRLDLAASISIVNNNKLKIVARKLVMTKTIYLVRLREIEN